MMNLSSLSKAKFCTLAVFILSFIETGFVIVRDGFGLSVLLISLVTGLAVMSYLYIRRLQASVKYAVKITKDLARGDFSARIIGITEQGDIGEFYHSINDMSDIMDAFVRESTACMQAVNENKYFRKILPEGMHGSLLQGTKTINAALGNVGRKMDDFSSIAHDVDESLQGVASEITETITVLNQTSTVMSRTVNHAQEKSSVAIRGAEQTSLSVDTISSASEEMSASIAEISQQISKTSHISSEAVKNAEVGKERMANLAETVDKISHVVQLIEEIANQTNLLALNATIESARAGEAGKGFSVVANEVKALAGETTTATEDIRRQIEAIQGATQLSVQAFEEISSIVNEMNTYTANISAAVEEQSAASREIANSAHRAADATNSVTGNMTDLGKDVSEVGRSASGVIEISDILSQRTIVNVKDLVAKMNSFMAELKKVV